jgi:hypothetical protein
MSVRKFIAAGDEHVGFELIHGRKVEIHDLRAWEALIKFAEDFKPDAWISAGDQVDCGPISHWNKGKRQSQEGLRLLSEFETYEKFYLREQERVLGKKGERHWLYSNHLKWVDDFIEEHPGETEGFLDYAKLLKLKERGWKMYGAGEAAHLGKLHFLHGDTIGGGEMVAKSAVLQYERSIRIWHHHTLQTFSKVSALDIKDRRTGMVIPAMCKKNPHYARNRPNRWVTGFLYGYIHPDGTFNDYPVVITEGKFTVEGKTYRG